ncbi:MAG TPA: type I 3-dehydroquinate dehydratase [Polyangia bacterium]|jgi:3-dehydroquinate dehydratase-1|nr:type I 3-dehydroquinate dehydratase [Polyangia bacterium]
MASQAPAATSAPWLVGVVSRPASVEAFASSPPDARVVDLLEVRVDLFDAPDVASWAAAAARVEATGTPVLVTLRLAAEGGRWTRPDGERLALYREALGFASWVDVEASSPLARDVTTLARARGATSIVSHHDFARTPPLAELERLVEDCRAVGADLPKLATQVNGDAVREALLALAAAHAGRACVIGMGASSSELRTLLPARGSRFAYGYLDAATAPGQVSAVEMDARLRASVPAYAARRAGGE